MAPIDFSEGCAANTCCNIKTKKRKAIEGKEAIPISINKGVCDEVIATKGAFDVDRQWLLKALREGWTRLVKQIIS